MKVRERDCRLPLFPAAKSRSTRWSIPHRSNAREEMRVWNVRRIKSLGRTRNTTEYNGVQRSCRDAFRIFSSIRSEICDRKKTGTDRKIVRESERERTNGPQFSKERKRGEHCFFFFFRNLKSKHFVVCRFVMSSHIPRFFFPICNLFTRFSTRSVVAKIGAGRSTANSAAVDRPQDGGTHKYLFTKIYTWATCLSACACSSRCFR